MEFWAQFWDKDSIQIHGREEGDKREVPNAVQILGKQNSPKTVS